MSKIDLSWQSVIQYRCGILHESESEEKTPMPNENYYWQSGESVSENTDENKLVS